ncbi:MAG: hypothetical protein JOZ69_09490 [Myxococcales bacterium]|nr:hypothetical protein [Myxococcales bacterium]
MDAEELFRGFFLPVYPPELRDVGALARARAEDANPGGNASILAHLDDAAARFVLGAREIFGPGLELDGSDASVHHLSAALTRERRDAWSRSGEPGTPDNLLFNVAVHGSAYVGRCVVRNHGGDWGVRRPLWESVVRLRSAAGDADLAVFHWWLKALADDPQGTTLADRYRAHVEAPRLDPEAMAPFLAGERALPRLARPRYDTLHKYLRARVPEIRDVGEHFPSAARFEAFGLRWLDFHRVGAGRLLLLAGASETGVHLFWLSAKGYEKSVYLPCDAFPDPVVSARGDRVVVVIRSDGRERVHEMLWWGP